MGFRLLRKGEKFPARRLFLTGILLAFFIGWWTRGLVPDIRIVEVPLPKEVPVVSGRKGTAILERVSGLWAVRATVNSVQGVFIIDTGSASTILSKEFAKKAGVSTTGLVSTMISVTDVFRPIIAVAREVSVGGAAVKNLSVAIYDTRIGGDGIIGMDFFEPFELRLSVRNRTLDLRYAAPSKE